MLDFFIKSNPELSKAILTWLDDKDIAVMRQLNKVSHDAVSNYFSKMAVPYQSVFHFFINNREFFIDQLHELAAQMLVYIKEKEHEGFSSDKINNDIIPRELGRIKNLIRHCWLQYSDTYAQSISMHPAMIYKLMDKDDGIITQSELDSFAQGEDIYATRRIYRPYTIHTWPQNASWLQALIHKQKCFIIFSTINEENLHRTNDPDLYSAFAREIASVVKIGYQAYIHHGYSMRIMLYPIIGKQYQPHLSQLNPTDDDIDACIEKVIKRVETIAPVMGLSDSHARMLYSLNNAPSNNVSQGRHFDSSDSDSSDTYASTSELTTASSGSFFSEDSSDTESADLESLESVASNFQPCAFKV